MRHLPALWTAASADERLRFIRHLRPYWELGLHRAAPESNAWLQDARRAGRFRHYAGRVLRLSSAAGGRVAVSWRARGESRPQTLLVDRVFNTRGFEFDWTRIDDALLRNLLGKGLAVPHETGFGIAADPPPARSRNAMASVRDCMPWVIPCAACPGNPTPSASRSPAPPRP